MFIVPGTVHLNNKTDTRKSNNNIATYVIEVLIILYQYTKEQMIYHHLFEGR